MQTSRRRGTRAQGFSLVELLMALAITAVLTALALPGYGHVMHRALRLDARLALLRVQHRQEAYFASHLRYASDITSADPAGLALSGRSDQRHYLLELQTSADGMHYTVIARADPAGRQARDLLCTGYSLDETGYRRSADSANSWREDDPHRCWG